MSIKSVQYEKGPCGRCGGSGSYSFNLRHGSVCYGCNGSGKSLSRRGRAAKKCADAWKKEHVDFRASAVVIGDVIEDVVVTLGGEVGSRWARVLSIEPSSVRSSSNGGPMIDHPTLLIKTKSGGQHIAPHSLVRRKLRQDEMNGLGEHMRGRVGCEIEEA